jgi:hypothetical protein
MSGTRLRVGVNGRVLATPVMRGLTRYAGNLLRALSRRDDVELIVFTREEPWPEHVAGVRARLVRFDAPREALWDDWALPRRIRAEGVDVFHALADRGLPLVKPCPMVVTLHNSYERTHWRGLYRGTKRRLWYWKHELVNARRADAVVTVSDTTRDELIAAGVCRPERMTRVYLAPGPEFGPQPAADDAAVRTSLGLARPYVLFVGGYDAHKNVDALVRAFDRAVLPGYDLVLAAHQGPEFGTAWARWRALACGERLHAIEPAPSALPALYRGATLLAHPSRWESFGLQLVEAMASGCPVLAADRTAVPEIVGAAGLLCDPEDPVALAGALARLAGDPALQAALRERGLARARTFDWNTVADETVAVYRRALAA